MARARYFWCSGINPAGKRQLIGPANSRLQIDNEIEKHELEGVLIKQLPTINSGKASQHFRNAVAKDEGWRATLDKFSHGKKPERAEGELRGHGKLFDEDED